MFSLAACSQQTPTAAVLPVAFFPTLTPPPILTATAEDTFYLSSGGGEPRSPGYWLLWNTCAEGNQAETARANSGRAAGWIVMDDLLADPGVLIGEISVDTCQQGVNLIQGLDAQGQPHLDDPAYVLASQLMAAQLNLAAGSEYCPASDQAVAAAQLLLLSLDFDGAASYLAPPKGGQDVEAAQALVEQLTNYNNGELCR